MIKLKIVLQFFFHNLYCFKYEIYYKEKRQKHKEVDKILHYLLKIKLHEIKIINANLLQNVDL